MKSRPSEVLGQRPSPGFLLAGAWVWPGVLLAIGALFHSQLGWSGDLDVFMWGQDAPVLMGIGALFIGLRMLRPSHVALAPRPPFRTPREVIAALVVLTILGGWAGHHLVFGGYAFSRDEHLALFDAKIFASGHLMAETPAKWRTFVPALEPMFMLQIPGHRFWASGYLPINAALQAIGIRLGANGLISPLLAALSIVTTWAVGRRLWPDRPDVALLAAVLLTTSSQFLITAMTPYAMTAHLALNMSWLWLFLRGGRLGHAGALAVGFLACGLHQLIFHPLFVAPFILQLWLDRRWKSAVGYTLAYASICLFWTLYWPLMMSFVGVPRETASALGIGHYAHQVVALVSAFDVAGLGVMAKGLVRFMTWQNPLTIPLVVLGAWAAFRRGGAERSLLLGVILAILVIAIVLPDQVHGWGYRYLHGFLGSISLIAAVTWGDLTERLNDSQKRDARMVLATAMSAALVVLLPLRAWQANDFVRPFMEARRALERMPVDVVLVDDVNAWRASRLVTNDPFLREMPLSLPLASLGPTQVERLRATSSICVFGISNLAKFGILAEPTSAARAGRRAVLAEASKMSTC